MVCWQWCWSWWGFLTLSTIICSSTSTSQLNPSPVFMIPLVKWLTLLVTSHIISFILSSFISSSIILLLIIISSAAPSFLVYSFICFFHHRLSRIAFFSIVFIVFIIIIIIISPVYDVGNSHIISVNGVWCSPIRPYLFLILRGSSLAKMFTETTPCTCFPTSIYFVRTVYRIA